MGAAQTRGGLVATLTAVAYLASSLAMYWLQHQMLPFVAYLGVQAAYLSILAISVMAGRIRFAFLHAAMYFLVFHQYAANPYSEEFVNAISGPSKFLALAVGVSLVWGVRWKRSAALVLLCFGIYSTLVTMLGRPESPSYLAVDVLVYLLLGVVIAFRPVGSRPELGGALEPVLFRYVTILPPAYLFVYLAGLTHEVAGSTYYFYGHLFGFLVIWASFVAFIDGGAALWEQISVLISLALWIQVAQSEHILLALLLLGFISVRRLSVKSALATSIGVGGLIALAATAVPGTWLALKTGQLLSLATFDLQDANSLAIRFAQILNIIEGNSLSDHLWGNGLGAVYRDWGPFRSLLLHEETFPVEQIQSGRYFLIHVAPVKLFFNLGLIGFVAVSAIVFARLNTSVDDRPSRAVPIVFFFFFWHASIQASMFLGLFTLLVVANEAPRRAAGATPASRVSHLEPSPA